jgi:hypothetical protein
MFGQCSVFGLGKPKISSGAPCGTSRKPSAQVEEVVRALLEPLARKQRLET